MRVTKWGNILAVRLPTNVVQALDLNEVSTTHHEHKHD
jgi:antitoxin component of MazEF toxin-antitoxin module